MAWLRACDVDEARSVYLEQRRVRCGKRRCRCARGGRHGPYYYLRFAPADERRRRVYIAGRFARRVQRWVHEFHFLRAGRRTAMALVNRLYR